MKINYLGPAGTFSEKAAKLFASSVSVPSDMRPHGSIKDAASALHSSDDVSVLPYYNLLDGAVTDTIDALLGNNYFATSVIRLPICFDAACQGSLGTIKRVASHPKALAQCSEFINGLGNKVECVPVNSTAAAVILAEEEDGVLAIASVQAVASSSLNCVGTDVGDKRYGIANYTEFLAVRSKVHHENVNNDYTGCLLSLSLESGSSLSTLMARIEPAGFRLGKLITRPAPPANSSLLESPQAILLQLDVNDGINREELQHQVDHVLKGNWESVRCIGSMTTITPSIS